MIFCIPFVSLLLTKHRPWSIKDSINRRRGRHQTNRRIGAELLHWIINDAEVHISLSSQIVRRFIRDYNDYIMDGL